MKNKQIGICILQEKSEKFYAGPTHQICNKLVWSGRELFCTIKYTQAIQINNITSILPQISVKEDIRISINTFKHFQN